MDYGLCLPNFPAGASREGIEAAADLAAELGFSTVWTTDHVLVDHDAADDYGHIYEAILTLAWVGARQPAVRLGTSVIVVPQRNAVLLAKELATLDALSGGRVVAGVGVGWSKTEFANLGMDERFHVRGAYLDETIALWRHLWSGSSEPFEGRFHRSEDFAFSPLPAQGAGLPIVVGGGSEAAQRRAGTLGDGYHSSATGPAKYRDRIPVIRAAAEAAGRPMPSLSARVRTRFGEPTDRWYAMQGTPEDIAAEVRAWAALGVEHLAIWIETTDPADAGPRPAAVRLRGRPARLMRAPTRVLVMLAVALVAGACSTGPPTETFEVVLAAAGGVGPRGSSPCRSRSGPGRSARWRRRRRHRGRPGPPRLERAPAIAGRPDALVLGWLGGACDARVDLSIEPFGEGLRVTGKTDTGFAMSCPAVGIIRAVEIDLAQPVDPSLVVFDQGP